MYGMFQPIPFVVVSCNHGTMIVNRNDYKMLDEKNGMGMGYQILTTSNYDPAEIEFTGSLLERRRALRGDGVVALDCGANIGTHTIEWAHCMAGWGRVLAFEAQERIYYALAGNIAINNCFNASARHAAVGAACGRMKIPVPDYFKPASYGSLELKRTANPEDIGQPIDYEHATAEVEVITIDSLKLERLDFLKIDVEGMEVEVLTGAAASIEKFKPPLMIEIIKTDRAAVDTFLKGLGYQAYPAGLNLLAVHNSDPMANEVYIKRKSA